MSDIPGTLNYIQAEPFSGGRIVSEFVLQAVGSTINGLLSALGKQCLITTSCGSFSTTSGSLTAVTNLSQTIVTTTGRPILLLLIPEINFSGGARLTGNNTSVLWSFFRGSTQLNTGVGVLASFAPGEVIYIDTPSAGTYTYTFHIADFSGGGNTVSAFGCKLAVVEL